MRDLGEEKKEETTGTLRKDKTLLRDDKKMEKLKQKLHTDDERRSQPGRLHPRVTTATGSGVRSLRMLFAAPGSVWQWF